MIPPHYRNMLDNYQIIRLIAEGAYGKVYEAYDKTNQKHVALKQMIRHENEGPGLQSTTLREISLIKSMDNENVIKIIGTITNQPDLFIVLELLEGDLKSELRNLQQNCLPYLKIKRYMYQILNAVAHFHSRKIIHRDLKPENLLINSNGVLKVADFGLARKIYYPLRPYTLGVVTQPYRAPQILLEQAQYTEKIDIWSVGCIFAEMITKRIFFPPDGDYVLGQLPSIFRKLGTPTEDQWPGWTDLLHKFQATHRINFDIGLYHPFSLEKQIGQQNLCELGFDLLKKMFKYNPAQRISAAEALNHPYFNDFNEQ